MSLNDSLNFVNSYDARLKNLEKNKLTYQLPQGVKYVNYQKMSNANGNSNSSTQYNINLQKNQLLGTYLVEETDISFTVNLANADGQPAVRPLVPGYGPTLKFMPLTSASQSITITVNGIPMSVNPQDIVTPLWAFNKDVQMDGYDLPSASLLDCFAQMTGAEPQFGQQAGALKNPMLDYFSSTYGIMGRSCVELVSINDNSEIAGNTNRNLTIVFRVREPIWTGVTSLSNNYDAFVGATSVQITRNFAAGALENYMINLFARANITYSQQKLTLSNQTLYYVLMTPDDTIEIPYPTFYPVLDYGSLSIQSVGTVTANSNVNTVSSQSIGLTYVPKAIYIWIAPPQTTASMTTTNAPGYQITNLSLSYGGAGGQFQSMSQIQLYEEFCARQGFVKAYYETGLAPNLEADAPLTNANAVGLFGTVLRIDGSMLQGIDWNKYSIGSEFPTQLQVTVNYKSLYSADQPTNTLFVQVVNDAVLEIDGPSSAILHKSILTAEQVQQVRQSASYELEYHPMLAGNFFSNIYNKVLKPVGKFVYDHRSDIVPIVKGVAKLAAGRKKPVHHKKAGALVRHHSRHHLRGGNLSEYDSDSFTEESDEEYVGGQILTKQQIKNRLKY